MRMLIRTGPGMEKIRIRDKYPGSATEKKRNIFVIFVGILKTTEEQRRIQIRIRFRNLEVRVRSGRGSKSRSVPKVTVGDGDGIIAY